MYVYVCVYVCTLRLCVCMCGRYSGVWICVALIMPQYFRGLVGWIYVRLPVTVFPLRLRTDKSAALRTHTLTHTQAHTHGHSTHARRHAPTHKHAGKHTHTNTHCTYTLHQRQMSLCDKSHWPKDTRGWHYSNVACQGVVVADQL
jgi:hypothetical protein